MTPEQIKQQYKSEALNAIRKIFHPLTKNHYFQYTDESYGEQRESMVKEIIEKLEKDLTNLKLKTKKKNETT